MGATAVDSQLVITGTTDLPDDTVLQVSAWMPDDGGPSSYQDVRVSNGRIHSTASISSWPAGDITVSISFAVGPYQPTEVTEVYGDDGERLTGPHVIDDSGRPTMRLILTVPWTG